MRHLRRLAPVSFTLALILALTGVMLAHARGQVMADGAIVLCTGAGPVTVDLDAGGAPTGRVHICPDMALSLLAGLDAPAAQVAPSGARSETDVTALRVAIARAVAIETTARGPPLAV